MEEFLLDNNLSLVESEEKYRSVITNVKIKKGTIIISSPAMGIVLMENARETYCHNCLSLMQKNKNRCSRCKVAHYCSKECQINAWKNGHKYTCKLWKEKKLFDNDLMDVDLLIQVVLQICKWDNDKKTPTIKKPTTFEEGSMRPDKLKDISENKESLDWKEMEEKINREAFLSLMTHQDKIEFEEWKYLRDMAKVIFLIAPDLETKTSESELIQHLLRFKCNNFVCHDTQLFGIAESAFPVGSLFNHSCMPNATLYYHGNRQILRAMRDIQQGEEICITYTDVMNSRKDRKKLLLEKYKFECHCERCIDDHGIDEKLIPLKEEEDDDEEEIKDDKKLSKKEKEEEEEKRKKKELDDFNWLKDQLKTDVISLHDLLDLEKCKMLEVDKKSIIESYPLYKFIVKVSSKLLSVLEFSDEDYFKVHSQVVKEIEPIHLKIFTLICKFTYYCIDNNDHLHAAYASFYVLMAYLVFLGRNHPLTGLQWLTFGKLVWNISDDYKKEALYSLYRAKDSIMISEGRSDILEEIENLIKQIS